MLLIELDEFAKRTELSRGDPALLMPSWSAEVHLTAQQSDLISLSSGLDSSRQSFLDSSDKSFNYWKN